MPEGKYFYIRSKLNGLVLDVKGAARVPNTEVVTWPQKAPGDSENQLWYEDPLRGVIRSKQTGLCLDITDDSNDLVTNTFDAKRTMQHWMITGDKIQNRSDPEKVLDIAGKSTRSGARVCAWKPNGQLNQQWTFEYTQPRYFFLTSVMHGKVVDIKDHKRELGAKAVMMDKEDPAPDSQLWYENKHSMISSKMHGYVLDTSHKDKVRLNPFEPGSIKQLWTFQDDRIVNHVDTSMVLDIKGAEKKNGAKLLAFKWHGKDNQKWRRDYQ